MDTLTGVEHLAEPDGFRYFVAARSGALLRSGWLLTGDWPSAEDLVQTALAAAWPRWASLRRQDAPELYVRKIMVNTFLRWRQRRWTGEIATGRLPSRATSQPASGITAAGLPSNGLRANASICAMGSLMCSPVETNPNSGVPSLSKHGFVARDFRAG